MYAEDRAHSSLLVARCIHSLSAKGSQTAEQRGSVLSGVAWCGVLERSIEVDCPPSLTMRQPNVTSLTAPECGSTSCYIVILLSLDSYIFL